MKWPLVWRSTMERAVSETIADQQAIQETRVAAALAAGRMDANEGLRQQLADASQDAKRFMDAYLRHQDEEQKLHDKLVSAEHDAAKRIASADAERVRAEVRAQEWEAIAMELVAKGAGLPRLDTPDRPENKVAKKIREEAQGDNTLIAHWNKMAAQMKKDGKTEDEILAAIGWVDANPPTDQAA